MNNKYLSWVNGLKGISCIFIFLHHFLLAFYPSTYYGTSAVSHTSYDTVLSQHPLSAFFNGNFLVCIFCILSSFLISYQVFLKKEDFSYLSNSMLKRYFRLAFPVFFISLIIFLMMKLSLFSNVSTAQLTGSPWLAQFYTSALSLKDVFTHSFFTVWITSDNLFSTAFWMLTYIFYGSFLSYVLCIMTYRKNKKIIFLFFIPAAFFCIQNSLLLCFVLGTLSAYLYTHSSISSIRPYVKLPVGGFCILSGVFLGGYPTYQTPTNVYALLNHLPSRITPQFFYHVAGASLLIIGIGLFHPLHHLLESKPFAWLGRLSFSIYLIHIPLLFSFSTSLFRLLYQRGQSYHLSCLLTFFASLILLLLSASLFYSIPEKLSARLTGRILHFFQLEDTAS